MPLSGTQFLKVYERRLRERMERGWKDHKLAALKAERTAAKKAEKAIELEKAEDEDEETLEKEMAQLKV